MIKKNLLSNFLGKLLTLFFSIFFLPYYIHFLGTENYGLVGTYITLLNILSLLLDLGLSTTVNREMASLSSSSEKVLEINHLARTLEIVYWVIGCCLAIVLTLSSSWIAQYWFKPQALTPDKIQSALIWIGLNIASIWPYAFYSGALSGLEKQFSLNVIICSCTIARTCITFFVLMFISPTIQAFFICQMSANLVQTFLARFLLWRYLPRGDCAPRFKFASMKKIGRFSAGMSLISLTAIILTNLDKVLLSKLLTLEAFGYYMFATSIANGIGHISGPIFSSFFPRFSQLAAQNKEIELKYFYHLASQLMSCLVLPVAICLILFTPEILKVWGVSAAMMKESCTLIPFLILGTTLNSLVVTPYALQLAYGWTRLTILQNISAIIVLILPLTWVVKAYGVIGAAMIFIVLNLGYIFISIPIMHRKLLKDEIKHWYLKDCFIPLTACLTTLYLCRLLLPITLSRLENFMYLGIIFIVGVVVCFLSAPLIRTRLFTKIFHSRQINS